MISAAAVWLFDKATCTPYKRSHTAIGGPTIPLKQPKSNRRKKWTWPGSAPHPTRMHAYASLTSDQKAAWKTLADGMDNGHSAVTPGPYSGAIAYMVCNLYRRSRGMAYTDDAPTDEPPGSSLTGAIQVALTSPRTFVAELTR